MEYRLIKSARKTLALEITADGEVVVRAPLRANSSVIDSFVNSHADWITKKLTAVSARKKRVYTDEQIKSMRMQAKRYIPERVNYLSEKIGLYPTGVKITGAKTRFGSCSGKNSLCFSLYLMDYPQEAVDYVIIHELCHIKHHNHSTHFWAEVARAMPDYKERKKMLSEQ